VLIGVGIIIYGIYSLIKYIRPSLSPNIPLPSESEHIGFYIIIGLIIGFCGFLIGAFTSNS